MKTKFIFIRHGEPRYDEVTSNPGFKGRGYDMGKLTERGIEQAEKVSKNQLLKDAQIIIASPYTRALQTAAIISRNLNLPLEVEIDLHEWFPDKEVNEVNVNKVYKEYILSQGVKNETHQYNWETRDEMKDRLTNVLKKYSNYDKVIVVCHGMLMTTVTKFDDVIQYCGVREVSLDE